MSIPIWIIDFDPHWETEFSFKSFPDEGQVNDTLAYLNTRTRSLSEELNILAGNVSKFPNADKEVSSIRYHEETLTGAVASVSRLVKSLVDKQVAEHNSANSLLIPLLKDKKAVILWLFGEDHHTWLRENFDGSAHMIQHQGRHILYFDNESDLVHFKLKFG